MTWIVREGTVRGQGRRLWGFDPPPIWSLGGPSGAGGGGLWCSTAKLVPWWEDGQAGAVRFGDRAEAARKARLFGGRVVRLSVNKLTASERAAVNADNIITAIRSVRERLDIGLKEAKDYVEATPAGRAFLERRASRAVAWASP